MNKTFREDLNKSRKKSIINTQFFSYGIVAVSNGFTLIRSESTLDAAKEFPITSAGVLIITLDPKGNPCILLVNEEANRWDISSGKVDSTDQSPEGTAIRELHEETAIRELHEETGIKLEQEDLIPLTYAINSSRTKAGVQFLAFANLEHLNSSLVGIDEFGRHHYIVVTPEGNLRLVLESLEIFLDTKHSLLVNSHHPWAYKLTKAALGEKFALMNEMK